ncbi:hypothetical protein [Paenibacillus ihuae]|uniref:hypothetical protein n=1 Tax=Paenibacillus ihuae TaxID=1232431 RepID=UPI0006D59CC9|nr:hypothetical protein [Paenibacillus ihuae]
MEYLHFLPVFNTMVWFGILLFIVYGIDFFRNYPAASFAYASRRPSWHRVTLEVLIFVILSSVVVLLIALYFVIGKLYMKPVYTSYAADYQIHPRVNIKLVSGEILPGMYLLQHAGRGDIIAGDHIHRSEAAHIYCINRDQILYIEAAGNAQQRSGL